MGTWFSNFKNSPKFWEFAFFIALVLLILSHKLTLEGMIE